MNRGPKMNLRHRIGARLIDFSVDHLLSPGVAAAFREQLKLGNDALTQKQTVTVQLREDLRDTAWSVVAPPQLTAGGPGMAPHEAVDAALKTLPPEARRGIKWSAMRAAINAAAPYVRAQHLRDLYPTGPGTYSPNPDPNQLPEGI